MNFEFSLDQNAMYIHHVLQLISSTIFCDCLGKNALHRLFYDQDYWQKTDNDKVVQTLVN